MKQTKSMKSNILKATYVFAALFIILGAYLLYYVVVESAGDINNPYNKRTELFEQKIIRGNIYSKDMDILAQTLTDDSGKEIRVYPYDELFCHVVGSFDKGRYGLEQTYDFQLLGTNASLVEGVAADINNQKLQGNSIVTTLDVELQNICYEALGKYDGAVMIMDAKTGDVLAMVSKPGYNPNDITKIWEDIRNDDKGALLNRVTYGLYPPGSVFKLFTLGEYISEHESNYEEYSYECSGTVNFVDFTMSCSNKRAHGLMNLAKGFAESCNCTFVDIGSKIKIDKFRDYCDEKLFNRYLPIELPHTLSQMQLKDNDSEFIKSQTVIGQGKTLVTPIHMCMVMSAIANDGIMMKPRFVSNIIDAKGNIVKEIKKDEYSELYTANEA